MAGPADSAATADKPGKPGKAVYYNSILAPKVFDVLKKNPDGTVDIGSGETLVVGKCQVVKFPKEGCVTLGADPVEAPEEEEKAS